MLALVVGGGRTPDPEKRPREMKLHRDAAVPEAVFAADSNMDEATNVASEAVRTRPVDALRMAAELPESPANDELIRRATMEWAVTHQADALVWARGIEDDEFRNRVLAGVTLAWAETDPAAAGTFAANELTGGRAQDDAVVGIAQRWVQSDPQAAAAWIASFPTGSLKDAAVESITPIWAMTEPEAARGWRVTVIAR